MSSNTLSAQPVFSTAIRWALCVLSWLAFAISAYLAWHSINNSSVAGCTVGSQSGCDAVLNSSWSKWLGIPVAVLGLACYASLAGLSVLLGIQSAASRWLNTVFVLLAVLAAGASIWFLALQAFVIGEFCLYCVPTDICGIAIGALALLGVLKGGRGSRYAVQSGGSSVNTLSALRSAIPASARPKQLTATATSQSKPTAALRTAPSAASRSVPLVGASTAASSAHRLVTPPPLPVAFGGAVALLAMLIGGQVVFPSKMFEVQQVALTQPIDLSGADSSNSDDAAAGNGETRVAMRIPADGEDSANDAANLSDAPENSESTPADPTKTEGAGNDSTSTTEETASPSEASSTSSKRERKIKLLGGKLTIDTYAQPIIGSPEAPHIVVEMISYNCPHCRKANPLVKKALARYGSQVALVVLIFPSDRSCNKLVTEPAASHAGACTTAKLALAISKLRPASFARFHEYLMTGKTEPPAIESIIAKAYTIADRAKLKEVRESEEVRKQIEGYVDLYATLRQQHGGEKDFGLPVQILGDHVMSGSVEKADDIYKAWEEHLGVKRP